MTAGDSAETVDIIVHTVSGFPIGSAYYQTRVDSSEARDIAEDIYRELTDARFVISRP